MFRVVRWQKKDHHEVNWHPDFIGVGDESIVLRDLRAGATYALRVAAVNTMGRAWSDAAVFSTLAPVHCADTHHWQPLLDEADTLRVCHAEHTAYGADDDPDGDGECAVGWTEYLLAGLAAGGTIVVLLIAVVLDRFKSLKLLNEEGGGGSSGGGGGSSGCGHGGHSAPQELQAQFYGLGGSAHFDNISEAPGGACAVEMPEQPEPPMVAGSGAARRLQQRGPDEGGPSGQSSAIPAAAAPP